MSSTNTMNSTLSLSQFEEKLGEWEKWAYSSTVTAEGASPTVDDGRMFDAATQDARIVALQKTIKHEKAAMRLIVDAARKLKKQKEAAEAKLLNESQQVQALDEKVRVLTLQTGQYNGQAEVSAAEVGKAEQTIKILQADLYHEKMQVASFQSELLESEAHIADMRQQLHVMEQEHNTEIRGAHKELQMLRTEVRRASNGLAESYDSHAIAEEACVQPDTTGLMEEIWSLREKRQKYSEKLTLDAQAASFQVHFEELQQDSKCLAQQHEALRESVIAACGFAAIHVARLSEKTSWLQEQSYAEEKLTHQKAETAVAEVTALLQNAERAAAAAEEEVQNLRTEMEAQHQREENARSSHTLLKDAQAQWQEEQGALQSALESERACRLTVEQALATAMQERDDARNRLLVYEEEQKAESGERQEEVHLFRKMRKEEQASMKATLEDGKLRWQEERAALYSALESEKARCASVEEAMAVADAEAKENTENLVAFAEAEAQEMQQVLESEVRTAIEDQEKMERALSSLQAEKLHTQEHAAELLEEIQSMQDIEEAMALDREAWEQTRQSLEAAFAREKSARHQAEALLQVAEKAAAKAGEEVQWLRREVETKHQRLKEVSSAQDKLLLFAETETKTKAAQQILESQTNQLSDEKEKLQRDLISLQAEKLMLQRDAAGLQEQVHSMVEQRAQWEDERCSWEAEVALRKSQVEQLERDSKQQEQQHEAVQASVVAACRTMHSFMLRLTEKTLWMMEQHALILASRDAQDAEAKVSLGLSEKKHAEALDALYHVRKEHDTTATALAAASKNAQNLEQQLQTVKLELDRLQEHAQFKIETAKLTYEREHLEHEVTLNAAAKSATRKALELEASTAQLMVDKQMLRERVEMLETDCENLCERASLVEKLRAKLHFLAQFASHHMFEHRRKTALLTTWRQWHKIWHDALYETSIVMARHINAVPVHGPHLGADNQDPTFT